MPQPYRISVFVEVETGTERVAFLKDFLLPLPPFAGLAIYDENDIFFSLERVTIDVPNEVILGYAKIRKPYSTDEVKEEFKTWRFNGVVCRNKPSSTEPVSFNRALTDSELLELYNDGNPVTKDPKC